MVKIKEIQPNCIYLFSGKASANSVFIESLQEAHEFVNSANIRFKNFMKIHEYLLTKDGWSMVCEIESEDLINSTYLKDRKSKGKKYKKPAFDEVWRIISEQVRHWLSRFVKICNFTQGRTGGKVHSNYERRIFTSVIDAKKYIADMHEQRLDYGQEKKRYQGSRGHFRVHDKKAKGHVFLCSKGLKGLIGRVFEVVGAVVNLALMDDVLRKLIETTLSHHFPTPHTSSSPKKE